MLCGANAYLDFHMNNILGYGQNAARRLTYLPLTTVIPPLDLQLLHIHNTYIRQPGNYAEQLVMQLHIELNRVQLGLIQWFSSSVHESSKAKGNVEQQNHMHLHRVQQTWHQTSWEKLPFRGLPRHRFSGSEIASAQQHTHWDRLSSHQLWI